MSKLTKQITEAIKKASKPTTSAYDTTAVVRRIEGKTAWVHIPGGVDETPVKRTIDAKAGDTVQVRVSGGSAWLVGNHAAPPTDDTKAKEAIKEVNGVKKHFWYDASGAHMSDTDGSISDGSSLSLSQDEICLRRDGRRAMELLPGKLKFYAADGKSLMASYGASGTELYASGVRTAEFNSGSMTFYKSDGTTRVASIYVDPDYDGSVLKIGAGEGTVRAFNLSGGTPTDLIMYNGLADSYANSVPYAYFKGTGGSCEVSIGVQGYFSGTTFWRGLNDGGNGIIIDTNGIELDGTVDTSGNINAGKYLNSEYAYNNPGGAAASTVSSHTVYIASNGNLLMGSSSSSSKYKHDISRIKDYELDPNRLYDLPVIQFVYNEDYLGNEKDCRYHKTLPGFIAEDVAWIYPTAADIDEEGKIVGWNEHYIIPPMLKLIQEQNKRIKALEEAV